MNLDFDILSMIYDGNIDLYLGDLSDECVGIIKAKANEIPSEFYEPKFVLEGDNGKRISLIEFSLKTAGLSTESKNGLMMRYRIDPYDYQKLQNIVDSINVVRDYGIAEKARQNSGDKKAKKSDSNMRYWVG